MSVKNQVFITITSWRSKHICNDYKLKKILKIGNQTAKIPFDMGVEVGRHDPQSPIPSWLTSAT